MTATYAEQYARLIADEVLDLESGILDGYDLTEHDPADRPYEAAMLWLSELALDVEVTRSLNADAVTAVTITRTVGGPWCAVTFSHYSEHTVTAASGHDRATVKLYGRQVAIVADVILDYYAEVKA
jgi:hypothetical protein